MLQFLTAITLPAFLEQLKNVTVNLTDQVVESPPNIKAIVIILSTVASKSLSLDITIRNDSMEVCGFILPKFSHVMC